VIAYVDSSVLARAYLHDEDGHAAAQALLSDQSLARVTGRWTHIETSGALVRAARAGRHVSEAGLLASLDADLRPRGRVTVVGAPPDQVDRIALGLVRAHGLRALDAWHLAVASLAVPPLADRGEPIAFASRDGDQAAVAEALGFERI
jgi:predicted nucleic acid-binding protein